MLCGKVFLVALGLVPLSLSQDTQSKAYFEELERFWSYGRSPSVYPSPESSGLGDWDDAYAKAKELVAQMTMEEKENVTIGYQHSLNGCVGKGGSVPRLGFPGFCMSNAGNGVGGTEGANAYPAALHVGASWNRQLAYDRALHMGREFKAKGANVALGPAVGPLGRVAKGGRNWEATGNDPYLTGVLAYETILGLQKSVIACLKHIVGNEQETSRKPPRYLPNNHNQSLSSNIDDKTIHELYLWPFQDSVRAGVGSVMSAYQRTNNSDSSQNSKVLNGLLKTELAFQGFVVSDWFAHQSGLASAQAGLDVVMPVAPLWSNGNLTKMVNNGSLPLSRLDDMVTRSLAAWYKYGSPSMTDIGHGLPVSLTSPHQFVDARDPSSKKTIFQGAVEGHVLVKNVNKALPLRKPKFLSIFGYDAVAQKLNTRERAGFSLWGRGMAGAHRYANGSELTMDMYDWFFASSVAQHEAGPEVAFNGTLITGGGSGATAGPYIDAPLDAFQRRAYDDDTLLAWDVQNHAPDVNAASEACIVFINAQATEGWDRKNLTDSYSDNLVNVVAEQCNNTMVVVHAAGVRLVDAWYDHPNITAVVLAHLPGQDSGRSLVEVMYGKQSFSGRLPYTVAKREADYGSLLDPVFPSDETPYYPQSNFTEGVYIDYKHFLKHNITPRFEFGFGLTYTNFEYANLTISVDEQAASSELPPRQSEILPGGLVSLWDEVVRVSCTVTNVGDVAAAEVAQLYLGVPGGPERVLRGFEKRVLEPGEGTVFEFALTRRDVSSWDVVRQGWVLQRGSYEVYVGKSVLDTPLRDSFEIL
ncbi:hypothetical protein MCOR27_009548 [Pyricularia oryzae]|nr:hypothetical protein MCOR01_002756 [Pyricularia oryzae]KAI6259513.1 hypothetical protein MCOR19_004154 [Pyricularia oryzae]KAI6269856.1 hypothetical protein MCOR27_009548 [Pyricularia oryzae]KAI6365728.1 hypothetical protein MCOR31_006834 [Pyricularia oryzae]KAI6400561.1 hypothetical protein MCOR23_004763 [Pyricularia oryzae]